MIKYQSIKQIPIKDFVQPFGGTLSKDNRWVKLANLLPWDEFVSVYTKSMSQKMGRKAINPRVAVGALIIKHILRTTDEDTIEFIKENPYLQYFLGYEQYRYTQPFTPSLFVSIRRRLGLEGFNKLSEHFMNRVHKIEQEIALKKNKDHDDPTPSGPQAEDSKQDIQDSADSKGENKGHLIVDATIAPSDIKYPTDLDLLNDARQHSEQLIDLLYVSEKDKTKPRTYRKKAGKDYLMATKQRKKRKTKIRKAIKSQLNYLRRNLKSIDKLLEAGCLSGQRAFPLDHKHQRIYWIIQELYRQQKQMYDEKTHKIADRIVSISQPHIRPMVRGKAGKEVEFGAKLSVSLVNGYSYLDRVSWDAYNEGTDLIAQIKSYKQRFGYYPEWVSADTIYGSRENRNYMKEHGINYSGLALGRRPKELTQERIELGGRTQKERSAAFGGRKFLWGWKTEI